MVDDAHVDKSQTASDAISDDQCREFYIPHHEALTEASTSTQLRVVCEMRRLNPSTVVVKMMFQQLWKAKIDWHDVLPTTINCSDTKMIECDTGNGILRCVTRYYTAKADIARDVVAWSNPGYACPRISTIYQEHGNRLAKMLNSFK